MYDGEDDGEANIDSVVSTLYTSDSMVRCLLLLSSKGSILALFESMKSQRYRIVIDLLWLLAKKKIQFFSTNEQSTGTPV